MHSPFYNFRFTFITFYNFWIHFITFYNFCQERIRQRLSLLKSVDKSIPHVYNVNKKDTTDSRLSLLLLVIKITAQFGRLAVIFYPT